MDLVQHPNTFTAKNWMNLNYMKSLFWQDFRKVLTVTILIKIRHVLKNDVISFLGSCTNIKKLPKSKWKQHKRCQSQEHSSQTIKDRLATQNTRPMSISCS